MGLEACCGSVAKTTRTPSTTDALLWSPHLNPASAAEARALQVPFTSPFDVVLLQAGGSPKQATISDCNTYFELRPKGYEPLSQPDLAAMKIEGANCFAVRAVQNGRPSNARPIRPFLVGQRTLARLPPALGPQPNPTDAARRKRATASGMSWATTDPAAILTVTDEWTARVKGPDWITDLSVLVQGDLNGDGVDDVLVETISAGMEGSWSEVRLRLLTSVPNQDVLEILEEFAL
ncbi:MAG TPA: hypothetical protein VH374_10510 [Polyangia bacterium]|nr:hypothetical protein [Polyangia bacterium]